MKKLMLLGSILAMFSMGSLKAENNCSGITFHKRNVQDCHSYYSDGKRNEMNKRYIFNCWCPHKGSRHGCNRGCRR